MHFLSHLEMAKVITNTIFIRKISKNIYSLCSDQKSIFEYFYTVPTLNAPKCFQLDW